MIDLSVRPFCLLLVTIVCCMAVPTTYAQNEGLSDLDEATIVKLRAKSMSELAQAIDLCKSAIKKGLDDDAKKYATLLLSSSLFERASHNSQLILEQRPPNPRWQSIRKACLEDLEEAIGFDEKFGEAYLLVARLQALPLGNANKAKAAAEKAIEFIQDNKVQLSDAYVVKGALEQDGKKRFDAYNEALKLHPDNASALRGRAILLLEKGEVEKANEDFNKILTLDPNDLTANQAIAQILVQEEKFDDALKYLDKALKSDVKVIGIYLMKAEILEVLKKKRSAIATLSEASKAFPQSVQIWLMLARLRVEVNDVDLAAIDIEQALRINPDALQAYLLRSVIASSKGDYSTAIRDIRRVINKLSRTPNSDQQVNQLRLQLAMYFITDKRPSRAIAVLSQVLENDPQNAGAYRSRGDAFLSLGRHREAISDYEAALDINADDSGAMNNLAWVLATSPKDGVRDGKRSVELATKACEVTQFKAAHILSTLAASHAEDGDFDAAVKWSTKAVELDQELEQLASELESYKQRKPWRELQQVKEKPDADPNDADLELGLEPDDSDLP